MAIRQALEPSSAVGDSVLGTVVSLNGRRQMVVVVLELEFHEADERRVSGQRHGCAWEIALGFHQGLEAHAFQPVGDGAAIPVQGPRGGLHVEPMFLQTGQHDGIPCGIGQDGGRFPAVGCGRHLGRQPQVGLGDARPIGESRRLLQAMGEFPHIALPIGFGQRLQGLMREAEVRPPELCREGAEERLGKERDIAPARAERRELEHEPLEAEE